MFYYQQKVVMNLEEKKSGTYILDLFFVFQSNEKSCLLECLLSPEISQYFMHLTDSFLQWYCYLLFC